MVRLHELNPQTQQIVRRVLREQMVSGNAMGGSSSVHGTGAVDTYDPKLGKKKVLKRRRPKTKVIINPTMRQTQDTVEVENN